MAIKVLVGIASNEKAPAAARATAANSLLDRGWGKAEAVIKSDVTYHYAEVPKTADEDEWQKILDARSGVPSLAHKPS